MLSFHAYGTKLGNRQTIHRSTPKLLENRFFGGQYILSARAGISQIEYLDVATRKRKLSYTLPKRALDWIGGLAVSSDGK
jgi:hypothetical protein